MSRDLLRAGQLGRELKESEKRLELAASAAHLGVWARDLVGNEIWASNEWRALFGFSRSEPLEFDQILRRMHPDDREAVAGILMKASEKGGDYETEYRVVLPDNLERWIGSRGRVECDSAGKAVLARGVSLDITARKQSEQEMLQLRQEIAHVGRVSMMGQLAAALAHEINQPLGAILRNAEAAELFMQRDSPDLDEVRAILEDIRKDDQRAGNVIDRMRALLRRHEIDARSLDVTEFVGEAAALTRGDAAARRINLDLDVPAELPRVHGDRVHLQQVLLNLMLNGMDAIDDAGGGGRRIVVRARLNGESAVEIAVIDSGSGISADRLPHVFDPFFTTKANGMGMGLPISRTIVEAHGGSISAENDAGRGATFRFTVPIIGSPAAI